MDAYTIVDVAQLTPVTEPFCDLASFDGRPIRWLRHSGLAEGWLERKVSRPKISRYRAAWNASADAERAAAVVSHMPWTAAMVARLMRLRRIERPQLAFVFNFTRPPHGLSRDYFRQALSSVAQFGVFTQFEADLYSERLNLPRRRFKPVLWTQEVPKAGRVPRGLVPDRPFVAALGGEGRDFDVLKKAAIATPDLDFVIVARPTSVLSDVPPNVRVLYNQPWETCWGIASKSIGLLVPLLSDQTCCGHITLVSGRLMGLPIVTTSSIGTREYSEGYRATSTVPAGEADGWIDAIDTLQSDAVALKAAAVIDSVEARSRHDRSTWSDYTEEFLRACA